ncbi:Biopolymer transport protein ExbD [Reichenbachiella faecimaris]|uniref:Biopolymer transport protein ExbD n=1 Tax=Reichenbachiella faecimaris TaxID=692418 RepID=A0A1W2G5V0_REIFA|nr:biopolymer transporter ExbD [Reichenbachiella faecimaris]SMD31748.1 Biopolymer transport protein ExbD [Reichenbachiella faecimaris]
MKLKKPKLEPKVSAGSMADIAFLLLIFFLVSTRLLQDKGLMLQLPTDLEPTETPIHERNLFKVLINSKNQYLIEGQVRSDLSGLVEEIKSFVKNPNSNPTLSESPEKAIISIKTQRGAQYASFISVLDLIKESYYQLYGESVGLSSDEFRKLSKANPSELALYQKARKAFPMNISIADPDKLK